jgi:hypothetical protein
MTMGALGSRRTVEGFVLFLTVMVLMAVAIGCTGEDDASEFDTVGQSIDAAGGSGSGSGAGSGSADIVSGSDDEPVSDDGPAQAVRTDALAASGQDLVSGAAMTVETADVAGAEDEAITLVESAGGTLFGASSDYGDPASAILTFKVPPANFSTTLHDLGELGTVVSQSVDTEVVTEESVDLDSRILTVTESIDRLREQHAGATTLTSVSEWEAELTDREAELEALRAQRRVLEGQLDLATIELTLAVDASQITAGAVGSEGEGGASDEALPGFADGLQSSWEVFVDVGTVALALVGVLLPWMVLVLAAWLTSRAWRRWARRTAAAPAE